MRVTHYKLKYSSKEGYLLGFIESSDLHYLTKEYEFLEGLDYIVELFRVGEELVESNFQKEIRI